MQMSLDSAPPYFNSLVLILSPSSAVEDVIQVSVVSQALRRGVSCTTMARPPTILSLITLKVTTVASTFAFAESHNLS